MQKYYRIAIIFEFVWDVTQTAGRFQARFKSINILLKMI